MGNFFVFRLRLARQNVRKRRINCIYVIEAEKNIEQYVFKLCLLILRFNKSCKLM